MIPLVAAAKWPANSLQEEVALVGLSSSFRPESVIVYNLSQGPPGTLQGHGWGGGLFHEIPNMRKWSRNEPNNHIPQGISPVLARLLFNHPLNMHFHVIP